MVSGGRLVCLCGIWWTFGLCGLWCTVGVSVLSDSRLIYLLVSRKWLAVSVVLWILVVSLMSGGMLA